MGNSNEKQVYIDEEGVVRSFNSKFVHCPQDEFFFISSCDVSLFQNEIEVEGGEDCYLVSVYWLNTWTRYVRSIGDNIVVGPINNIHLIDEKTRTLKKSVQYKTHFKTVSKAMWDYLFNAYGGGPVIGFRVPTGLDEKSYKTGRWMRHVKLHEITTILYPDATGKNALQLTPPVDLKNLVAAENAEMAAQSMLHSLGKSKLRLGVSMKKDIGAAHVEAIGTMFAKDIGKQKLAASQYVYSRVASNKDATQDALATAQNLREIGSVVMLQRCWRATQARKRQLALKAKQTCLMETGAALHLQGAWRRRQAKKRLEGLQLEAIQIRATELLQRVVRGLLCRQRVQKLIRTIRPHTAYLTMSELSLGKSDTKTCEVLVVASTYSVDSVVIRSAGVLNGGEINIPSSVPQYGGMTLVSQFTMKTGTSNRPSNASLVIPVSPVGSNSVIVLNVLSCKGTFLAQTTIDLRQHPQLYSNKIISFTDLELSKEMNIPVKNSSGAVMFKGGAGNSSVHISCSLRIPNISKSACGWMLRASTAFTTKGQLKRRWMILNHEDGTLSCHDGPFSIDVSKGVLEIWKVNEILEDTTSYQEGNVYRFLGGVGNWTVCLIGDAPYAWRRRLMQHIRLA